MGSEIEIRQAALPENRDVALSRPLARPAPDQNPKKSGIPALLLVEALLTIPAAVIAWTLYVSGPSHGWVVGIRVFVFIVVWAALTLIAFSLLKGRWRMVLVGLVGLIAWGLGALLWAYGGLSLAKSGSWWARTFYGPTKLARAQAKFAPKPMWNKMCARCGYWFATPVPTAQLCDRCRGVPQPADMIIPVTLGYMIGRHNQRGGS
jgi:hypothetical protein